MLPLLCVLQPASLTSTFGMHDLEPALYVKAYTAFAERRAADRSCKLPFLDYKHYVLRAGRPVGVRNFFCRAAEDCARQIINEIHALRSFIQDARIWDVVVKEFAEREQFLLTVEFLEVAFIHAMSRPYALKNRFIYSLAMLGTMYKARKGLARDVKPFEKCNYTSMLPLVQDWLRIDDLTDELANLNSEAFQQHSGGFRHKDHHRMPASIEVGLAPAARVWTDGGRIYLSNAVQDPIKVIDLLPALEQQYECGCRCLDRFWKVVQQRETDWLKEPNQRVERNADSAPRNPGRSLSD